jgi:hypothetical protein
MPVVCYSKKDSLAYITGTRIPVLFRAVARAVHPTITKEDKQQYSAHLLQVWACVLLDEAGKKPQLHQEVPLLDGRLLLDVFA